MPVSTGSALLAGGHGRPGARGRPGGHADDVRARRVRLRGAAARRQRLPAEGRRARRPARRDPGRGRRRLAARARRDPPGDRAVRDGRRRGRPLTRSSASSPSASGRSWRGWRPAGPTRRSPRSSWSVPTPCARTCSRAMVKLHARDRAQLVVFAIESGLTSPLRSDVGRWAPRQLRGPAGGRGPRPRRRRSAGAGRASAGSHQSRSPSMQHDGGHDRHPDHEGVDEDADGQREADGLDDRVRRRGRSRRRRRS